MSVEPSLIVIGDVHGCIVELKELLSNLGWQPGVRVILAGDLVDRGEDPPGVVRFARESGLEAVLGNHDEKHVRWAAYEQRKQETGKPNPMRSFDDKRLAEHEALTDEDRKYLANLPIYIRFEHEGRPWIVNHAGIPTDKPIEEQKPGALIRTRTVDAETGAFASTGNPFVVPAGSVYWTARWRGPESVVYGHIVQDQDLPRMDEPARGVRCYGIDTGCCFGGRLTAAVFVKGHEWPSLASVPAKRQYSARRYDE